VWADRSAFLDPTGKGSCQIKKRVYDLKENYCHEDARLEVKHLLKSLKLKDRERLVEQMETEEPRLENFIRLVVKSFRRNFKSIVSTKNIEFTLGSSIYVETV
jgi:hypothetical protein